MYNELIWVILIGISSLSYGLFNAFSAKENEVGSKYQLIAVQYSINLFIGICLLIIFWIGAIHLSSILHIAILLIWGIAWYIGIYSLFSGIEKSWPTLTMLIGNSYIVLLFFWNIFLYWGNEVLSPMKTVLGILFIIGIGYLVWDTRSEKKIHREKFLFPVLTGISWMLYSGTSTYIIKNSLLSPLTTLVVLEWFITVFAIITYLYKEKPQITAILADITKIKIALWILLAIAGITWFFSYKFLPANIVNILLLSQNIATIICMALILKKRYPLKEWILLWSMTLLLMWFVFV